MIRTLKIIYLVCLESIPSVWSHPQMHKRSPGDNKEKRINLSADLMILKSAHLLFTAESIHTLQTCHENNTQIHVLKLIFSPDLYLFLELQISLKKNNSLCQMFRVKVPFVWLLSK